MTTQKTGFLGCKLSPQFQSFFVLISTGLWWVDYIYLVDRTRVPDPLALFYVINPFCNLLFALILLLSHFSSSRSQKFWVYLALLVVALQWVALFTAPPGRHSPAHGAHGQP